MTLEGPVLRASPGSVLILFSAVGKVVRIEEELRISLPGKKNLENITLTTIFKDLMKDLLESFYIFCTCFFMSFLTSFYLHYHDYSRSSIVPHDQRRHCRNLYNIVAV